MTWERIDYLLDPKAKCIEIGALLVKECTDHGGCPSGGVVVKMGYIKETMYCRCK
jgi:acetyl-CoA carboxylase carboxyltransferase component